MKYSDKLYEKIIFSVSNKIKKILNEEDSSNDGELSSLSDYKESSPFVQYSSGDILSAPSEYSSRHPHFYEVIGFKGAKTIIVKELSKRIISEDKYGQNGSCIPMLGQYINKEFPCRINKYGDLYINDCLASIWNGKPEEFYTD